MRHELILVPTELERRIVEPLVRLTCDGTCRLESCGFGPVAAAARTARLLAEHRPTRVLLVGIAGRLDERLEVGRAYSFKQVACFGVGVGDGEGFQSAGQLGWWQWQGDPVDGSPQIGDVIDCSRRPSGTTPAEILHDDEQRAPSHESLVEMLVTACAASANREDARLRSRLFPSATAEDMEGFAVALACRLAQVSCDVVRGISNTAGDRDRSNWRVTAALEAAAELALRLMVDAT